MAESSSLLTDLAEWALLQQATDGFVDFTALRSSYHKNKEALRLLSRLEQDARFQESVEAAAKQYAQQCDDLARGLAENIAKEANGR